MPSLSDFISSLHTNSPQSTYTHAATQMHHVPLYAGDDLRKLDEDAWQTVQQEWINCWLTGPGMIVIKNFYADLSVIRAMNEVMRQLLAKEQQSHHALGDHFAKQGANRRIWNVFEKSAVENPEVFMQYYSNPLLDMVAKAWLGPSYKMTAQVNLVPPGGLAQDPHRDYHLGFQLDDEVAQFPLHAQTMSAMLTLQGAIAHVDMPIQAGPTQFLPFSQQYDLGYQIYQQDDFKAYFAAHAVQLPLQAGDGVFFSPALMHGAGANTSTHIERLANLLQISSPFGVTMEVVNHDRIQLACYETLQLSTLPEKALDSLLTIISDCYPFPTNLDRDTPEGALMPKNSKQLLQQALLQNLDKAQFTAMLADYRWRRNTA